MICLSKRDRPWVIISKVSNKIQNPGVGISDSRCIVKCDQKSLSVKHIPPHSSGVRPRLKNRTYSEFRESLSSWQDARHGVVIATIRVTSKPKYFEIYIFSPSLALSFFLAKFILIFLFSIQLRTRHKPKYFKLYICIFSRHKPKYFEI